MLGPSARVDLEQRALEVEVDVGDVRLQARDRAEDLVGHYTVTAHEHSTQPQHTATVHPPADRGRELE